MNYFIIFLIWIAMIVGSFGAWVQHIITCIHNEAFLLLIAGAIFFPIGIIHGWGIWLGFF